VLFVGGDFQRKGGDVLLEALAGPARDRCEVHLVTKARMPSTPGVHVHNGIGPNSPELIQLFSAADIFVLPTYADCLPLVLMEAAAAALPVVTTNVGALSEAVLTGRSGIVVPTGDRAALARAIMRLAEDAELRRTMGQAGHALANQKFDARRNSQALVDLVIDVADRGQIRAKAA
jgi:glycosyltransferase involved in cell wall biosynthesis